MRNNCLCGKKIDLHGYDIIKCDNCGQEWEYIEGFSTILTSKQLKILKGRNQNEKK